MSISLSNVGLEFIKGFEKFIPYVYDDFAPKKEWNGDKPKGTLTIGYGHTKAAPAKIDMSQGTRMTEPEALQILLRDLAPDVAAVNGLVAVVLKQHQFDALVSFRFNTGRLKGTGLLNRINENKLASAPDEFRKWVKSKGEVLNGLKRRREGEIDLWNKV